MITDGKGEKASSLVRRRGPGRSPSLKARPAAAVSTAPESLAKVVWRGRWIMLICLVLALTAGFVHIETATPIYTSTARLYLDYVGIPIVQSYGAGRMPLADRYLETQAEVLVSRPILEPLMESPDMQGLQTFANIAVRVAYVRRNIRVEVGRRNEIVSVSFDSPYAVEAAQIVNDVVDAYMDSRSDHEQRSSAQVVKILQEDLERARVELSDKQEELQRFRTNEMPVGLGSDQGSGVVSRYQDLETRYAQSQIGTMNAEAFLAGVEALAEDPVALRQYLTVRGYATMQVGTAGERASLEADLWAVQAQLEELDRELTADHPRIATLQRENERITARLQEMDGRFVEAALAAARQQGSEAKEYEAEVAGLLEEQRQEVRRFYAEAATYRTLQEDVMRLSDYLRTVEEEYKEIRRLVGEDVGQLRMEILETATVPQFPSYPHKAKIMTLALALGLLVGGGLAVLRDFMDQTIQSGDEISDVLGLPVLGVVPAMSRRQKVSMRGQKVHLLPESVEAEAFRTVRTAIFFGAPRERARTMLVTSPAAGDGKSTVASNLAIAMAQAGESTILVDVDFRKPFQHVIFEVAHGEGGLGSVLVGQTKLGQAIHHTPVEGLALLPCGSRVSNPSETLSSDRFAAVLAHLTKVYDRVVIDAPPVTVVTDAQILGAISDLTILVLRAEKSTRKISQRAMGSLQNVGAHILGAVVNDVRRSGDRYGYYGNYGGSNGSGRRAERVKMVRAGRLDGDRSEPDTRVASQKSGLNNVSR